MKRITKEIGWLLGLGTLLLSACMTEVDLEHLRKQPRVVLNARVLANDTVTASVTRTWFYTEDQPDIFLPDAEVDLWVNGEWRERMAAREVVEDYLVDERFLSTYICRPGDRIRITASHPDYGKASAEATVPVATPILDLKRTYRTIVDNYSIRHITDYDLTFQDNPTQKNYYMIQIEQGNPWRPDSLGEIDYRWWEFGVSFSRSPSLEDQRMALDKIFKHDESYYRGNIFPDDSFNGEEFVLKVSTFSYAPMDGQENEYEFGYDGDNYYGGGNLPTNDGALQDDPEEATVLRIKLYTLSESYYFYLRSLVSLAGYSLIGDLADVGLAAPVRVYSNVTEGGTGVLGTSACFSLIVPEEKEAKAVTAPIPR